MSNNKNKYSFFNNIEYVLKNLWEYNKGYYSWGILSVVAFVGIPICSMMLQKYVVQGAIEHWEVIKIIQNLSFFMIVWITMVILKHVSEIGFLHHQEMNRIRQLFAAEEVFLRCSYDKAEDSKNQIELEKVTDLLGTSNPRIGVNAMYNGIYEVAASVVGLIFFGIILGELNYLLVIIVAVSACIGGKIEQWALSKEFSIRMDAAGIDKKLGYFQRKLMRSSAGKDIRTYGCKRWLEMKLASVIQQKINSDNEKTKTNFLRDMGVSGIEVCQNAVVILWIVAGCISGSIQIADLLVYLIATMQLSDCVGKLIRSINQLQYADKDITEIRKFMDIGEEETDCDEVFDAPVKIEFRHVCFQYPGSSKEILSDVNFTIKSGENIAIVGRNGAGKTTLIKLLCGFYPVTKGKILLDDQDIMEMKKGEIYRRISAIFQDLVFVPYSVRKNVIAGDKDNNSQRIKECLEKAQILDKFPDLDIFIDKRVHKGGIELSGGEKQKLAFARALYKRAGILILDEPTAALDPIAESGLYKNYNEVSKDKTTLFISHRLASTSFCDRILLLDKGRIAEEGTHDELLKKNGIYSQMYMMQSQYYKKGPIENE